MTRDEEDKLRPVLARLSPEDRRLVEAQGYCPVLTDNRLGSMGKPVKVLLQGQTVFLCCKGCVNKALSDPKKTLAKVEEMKNRARSGSAVASQAPATIGADASKSAKIQAMLSQLSPQDRRLAEEQRFCPETDQLLGTMGVPIKVLIKDRPVFLCCQACEDDARKHPDQILMKLERWKSGAKVLTTQK